MSTISTSSILLKPQGVELVPLTVGLFGRYAKRPALRNILRVSRANSKFDNRLLEGIQRTDLVAWLDGFNADAIRLGFVLKIASSISISLLYSLLHSEVPSDPKMATLHFGSFSELIIRPVASPGESSHDIIIPPRTQIDFMCANDKYFEWRGDNPTGLKSEACSVSGGFVGVFLEVVPVGKED